MHTHGFNFDTTQALLSKTHSLLIFPQDPIISKMTTPMSSLDSSTPHSLIPPLTLAGASTPLANQVAGHQNVRADASGSLVIKVGVSYVLLDI